MQGPSTVPCGTPDLTGAELDVLPSSIVFCVLSDRKLLIHWRAKYSSDSIVFQFHQKPLMRNIIKG